MIYRLGHIILASLLFLSSTGFVLNKHYCKEELKSMALFLEAEKCHSEKMMKNCPFHRTATDEGQSDEKGCCDDTSEYIKSENEQISSFSEISTENDHFLIDIPFVVQKIEFPSVDKQIVHYLNYKPPLIVCDFPASLQTFLC